MKAEKLLLGIVALWFAATTAAAQGSRSFKINEVMVENPRGLVDEYGERSAWIEIANTSWGTNDLRSCYLTNDRRALDPSLSVPERVALMSAIPRGDARTDLTAQQRLVFFADGKVNRGTLHLNFCLQPGKENFIALFDGNGHTLLDSLTIPASLGPGQSYARQYDAESESYVWVVTPEDQVTPGGPNNSGELLQDKVAEFKEKDPYGIGMSIMGMGIVFLCLILLYVFFRLFGYVVASYERLARLKAVQAMREQARKATILAKHGLESKGIDKETYAAVIALALNASEEEVHDVESSVITLIPRKTEWNGKVLVRGKQPERLSNKN